VEAGGRRVVGGGGGGRRFEARGLGPEAGGWSAEGGGPALCVRSPLRDNKTLMLCSAL